MKVLQLFNNTKINIYDDEVKKILNGIKEKDQIIVLKNGVFNSSAFVAITELEDRRNQTEGMLHDGTLVIRHFGSWYLDGDFDENGKPYRRIDSEYYPEVQRDCVPTRKEFNLKYKLLSRPERLKLIIGGTEAPRISSGFKRIGEGLKTSIKKIIKDDKPRIQK